MKTEIQRRATARSEEEKRLVKPGQIVRELIQFALDATNENANRTADEALIEEVMASAIFARKALELVLSTHDGLAEKLIEASRAEVRRRRTGLRSETKQ